MKKKVSSEVRDFWDNFDKMMKRNTEQYKEYVNNNSGGEGWMCLSLNEVKA